MLQNTTYSTEYSTLNELTNLNSDVNSVVNSRKLKNVGEHTIVQMRALLKKWITAYGSRKVKFLHVSYPDPSPTQQKEIIEASKQIFGHSLEQDSTTLKRTWINKAIPEKEPFNEKEITLLLEEIFQKIDFCLSTIKSINELINSDLKLNNKTGYSYYSLLDKLRRTRGDIHDSLEVLFVLAKSEKRFDLIKDSCNFLNELSKHVGFDIEQYSSTRLFLKKEAEIFMPNYYEH